MKLIKNHCFVDVKWGYENLPFQKFSVKLTNNPGLLILSEMKSVFVPRAETKI